jgi:putative ABC transport system permease protein
MMTDLFQDLRFGVRMLLKNSGFTLACVLVLALGISLTTTIFTIVNGVVFSKLPFTGADRLMSVDTNLPAQGIDSLGVKIDEYRTWRSHQKSFDSLAAFLTTTLNLSGTATPERFRAAYITANAFPLTGVQPVLGRVFAAEDEAPVAPRVVLIGYRAWKSRFGGNAGIVGQTIKTEGEPATVIGVMPQGFQFPIHEDLWVPLRLNPAELPWADATRLNVVGRLRDGVSREQAQAEMASLLAATQADVKAGQRTSAVVRPYTRQFVGEGDRTLQFTMLGLVFFVLLVACSNVANLMLARTVNRTRELAVRTALGAHRSRVVRQLMTESFLLSLGGAVLGLLLTIWSVRLFNSLVVDPDRPFWIDIRVDSTVLLFAMGTALLAALLSGSIPALQAAKADIRGVLSDESRSSSSFRLTRLSRGIVIVEIALSYGLLIGAGLIVKTVGDLSTKPFNFQTRNILTTRMELFRSAYPDDAAREAFFRQLLDSLRGLPGVTSAAATSDVPTMETGTDNYTIEGHTYPSEAFRPSVRAVVVTSGFFDTFGVKPLEGREFVALDAPEKPPVVIVNQSFVRREWPRQSALGKRIRLGRKDPSWRTVVGVVPDIQFSEFYNEEPAGLYLPLAQNPRRTMNLILRTASAPLALVPAVRKQVAALNTDLSLDQIRTMEDIIAGNLKLPRTLSMLFGIFGLVALLLAVIGLYGLMSFSVGRRTAELGVRMALGSQREQVLSLVVKQAMRQLGLGLAVGLLLAFAVAKVVSSVFGVAGSDPVIFVTISLILVGVGLLASLLPARRATQVDPLVALRHE